MPVIRPTQGTGTLSPLYSNAIFSTQFNMITNQYIYGDNVKTGYTSLVNKARVEGSMYGDQIWYYSTDVLKSKPWGAEVDPTSLLDRELPTTIDTQSIVLDTFRQISLTLDEYLAKQMWMEKGSFNKFNSVLLGMIRQTKKVYDMTTYNTFIGTTESNVGKQGTPDITINEGDNMALVVAEALANLLVELKDVSRDYTDFGHLCNFNEGDLQIIWNSKFINAIRKIDLPVIFHNSGLLAEFDQEVLPERYFGKDTDKVADGDTICSKIEQEINGKHYFAGDVIDEGVTAPAGTAYEIDPTIAFKITHKQSAPYMSGFEVATSFYNAKTLQTNHYLTWGHNTLEYRKDLPFITRRIVEAAEKPDA